jgi:N-carbamoylputrescine amidase
MTWWRRVAAVAIKIAMDAGQVRIGLIQMTCEAAPGPNLEKAQARIEEAAGRGAQVICLQELYRSEYPCQSEDNANFDLAEAIPGPTTEALGRLAAARKVVIIAPIFERRAPGVYHNAALVIDERGRVIGHYRKMHIPDDPGYYEKFYFAPGDLDFIAHRTSRGSLGVLICWDQWFPEAARLTAIAGAQILFYPTAIGWTADMSEPTRTRMYNAWETVQRAHAITNGIFVAAVNRVGVEGDIDFWGGSFVSDPFGEVLARASHSQEETLVVDCDLNRIEHTRRNWPFLRDRRIDAYRDLTRRYRN